MIENTPSYSDLSNENKLLKLQLAELKKIDLVNSLNLKNAELIEMNEELLQTFETINNQKNDLKESDKRFNLLAQNISDIIWMLDLEGKITYLSPSASKILGYNTLELSKITTKDLLTESDFQIYKTSVAKRIEDEKNGVLTGTNILELKHIIKNGEIFVAEVVANPVRDYNNNLTGILGVSRDISSRKKIEDELKKLSVVIEQSTSSVVITDIDGNIEYVNATFTKVTGYSAEEAIGKNPRILKSGKTPLETYTELWQTILAGDVWNGEFINKTKWGEEYWEKVIIAPIKSKTGKITNFVSIKENITEKKNTEQELKEGQERYKFLSDITLEGIIIHDKEIILDVNQSVTKITGFGIEELINNELLLKLFTDESYLVILKNIESKNTLPFEATGIKKDGSFYPIEIVSRNFKYKNREINVAAIRDISYRKRVDSVLRSSLELNELANSKNEQEIISWGLEEAVRLSESNIGFFHYINDDQKTINLQVWSKQTLENCKLPEKNFHYPIEDAGTWIDSFYERKPVVHNDYANLPHKKGLPAGHFPLFRYISLPIIEDDKVKIIFGVGNKTKDYNQFDVDILSSFAENIWTVIQRIRSENQLQEANMAKDKFFSIISHDLRSPIGSIQSLTDVVVENFDTFSNAELFHFIKTINETSKSTYNLLDNMLLWAKSQSQKIEFSPVQITIRSLIDQVVQMFQFKIDTKNISVKIDVDHNLKVLGDKNMLETILRNLISNAIKFTSKKGSISIFSTEHSKNFLRIEVKDTGIGILEKNLSKIFNINESFSTKGTENEKGTGLGLIICKEFVELNGGKIWLESQEEVGTSFYFTLPIA